MKLDPDILAILSVVDDKASGKSRKGLATALGIWPSAITAMLDGRRKLGKNEVGLASAYLETALPSQALGVPEASGILNDAILTIRRAPVRGETAAGVWHQFEDFDEEKYSPIPYAPARYGNLEQFAYKVRGNSMDKEKIFDGDYVICVPFSIARATPTSGDVVVAERRRGALFERTCKTMQISEDGEMILVSKSSDRRYDEPIALGENLEETEVELVGLVVGTYRPRF